MVHDLEGTIHNILADLMATNYDFLATVWLDVTIYSD